jgi:hypothetical protein
MAPIVAEAIFPNSAAGNFFIQESVFVLAVYALIA